MLLDIHHPPAFPLDRLAYSQRMSQSQMTQVGLDFEDICTFCRVDAGGGDLDLGGRVEIIVRRGRRARGRGRGCRERTS
jgi:hypothetical protein